MGLLAEAVFDQDSQAPRGPGRAAYGPSGRGPLAPRSRGRSAGVGLASSGLGPRPRAGASGHLDLCAARGLPSLRGVLADLGPGDRSGGCLRAQLHSGLLLRLLRRCYLVCLRTWPPQRCLPREPRGGGCW